MLRVLMGRLNNLQGQMGKVNREMKTQKESNENAGNHKRNRMKTAFDGLLCRLNVTEDRLSELEDMSLEIPTLNCNMCVIGIPEEERENRLEEILELIMVENFLKLVTDRIPLQGRRSAYCWTRALWPIDFVGMTASEFV